MADRLHIGQQLDQAYPALEVLVALDLSPESDGKPSADKLLSYLAVGQVLGHKL